MLRGSVSVIKTYMRKEMTKYRTDCPGHHDCGCGTCGRNMVSFRPVVRRVVKTVVVDKGWTKTNKKSTMTSDVTSKRMKRTHESIAVLRFSCTHPSSPNGATARDVRPFHPIQSRLQETADFVRSFCLFCLPSRCVRFRFFGWRQRHKEIAATVFERVSRPF